MRRKLEPRGKPNCVVPPGAEVQEGLVTGLSQWIGTAGMLFRTRGRGFPLLWYLRFSLLGHRGGVLGLLPEAQDVWVRIVSSGRRVF